MKDSIDGFARKRILYYGELHTIPMSEIPKPLLSVEQYLDFELTSERRHEYVDGNLIQMLGKSKVANWILNSLIVTTNFELQNWNYDLFVVGVKVKTSPTRYRYPDIIIAPESDNEHTHVVYEPILLGEIVSPGTASTDYGAKLTEYAGIASLRYYIIIEQDRPYVLIHILQEDRSVVTTWVEGEDGILEIPDLNLAIPLAQLYRNVKFPDQQE